RGPVVGKRHLDADAELVRAPLRPARQPHGRWRARDDLDVAEAPASKAERLRHRLLRAEARGEVLCRPGTRRRILALALGEQPGAETRPALEGALEPGDL